jgi:hypothetical protein
LNVGLQRLAEIDRIAFSPQGDYLRGNATGTSRTRST